MIVIKKRILVFSLGLFFLFLFLGCHDLWIKGVQEMGAYHITFSPSQLKRGEIITIMFNDDRTSQYPDFFNKNCVVENGKLTYIDNDGNKSSSDESEIKFGIKVPEEIVQMNKGKKNQHISSEILAQIENSNQIPKNYLSIEQEVDPENTGVAKVTLRCIVPDNATSGHLYVFGVSNYMGLSDEPLIIVDESGNEITK